MWIFTGCYLSILMLFHSIAIFIPDTNPEKNLSIVILGAVTFGMDFAMFANFLNKYREFLRIIDEESKPGSCYRCFRFLVFAVWFWIFILDIIFITFLRPAGTVNFMGYNMEVIANDPDSPLAMARRAF
jgi:uncharacterized membrane-anchored protein